MTTPNNADLDRLRSAVATARQTAETHNMAWLTARDLGEALNALADALDCAASVAQGHARCMTGNVFATSKETAQLEREAAQVKAERTVIAARGALLRAESELLHLTRHSGSRDLLTPHGEQATTA